MDESMSFWIGAAASAAVHGVFAVFVLGAPRAPKQQPAPSAVSIEVVAPEPPPPEPAPELDAPVPERALAPAPRAGPVRETPVDEPPPPADPGPVELGGVTLTNDGPGASWSLPVSAASARPRASAPAKPHSRSASVAPAAPIVMAASDLSRRPSPPALDGALARNYPADLRRRGVGGVAVVRIRIDPDGQARSPGVVSETEAGFGDACRRTVLGSRWLPPLDKSGRPAATYVSYTCRFHVDGGG
jgi:protein TonB